VVPSVRRDSSANNFVQYSGVSGPFSLPDGSFKQRLRYDPLTSGFNSLRFLQAPSAFVTFSIGKKKLEDASRSVMYPVAATEEGDLSLFSTASSTKSITVKAPTPGRTRFFRVSVPAAEVPTQITRVSPKARCP